MNNIGNQCPYCNQKLGPDQYLAPIYADKLKLIGMMHYKYVDKQLIILCLP